MDGSIISSFYVHECEGSSRMGSRPRRFIFTGHSNGTIQMWDLTTALEPSFSSTQSNIIIFFFFFCLMNSLTSYHKYWLQMSLVDLHQKNFGNC